MAEGWKSLKLTLEDDFFQKAFVIQVIDDGRKSSIMSLLRVLFSSHKCHSGRINSIQRLGYIKAVKKVDNFPLKASKRNPHRVSSGGSIPSLAG